MYDSFKAQAKDTYTFGQNFLQRGAFKGQINDIPGFLNVSTNQFVDDEYKQYVGGTGTSQLNIENKDNGQIPKRFTVYQNYPNPFNPVTDLRYDLHAGGRVRVAVYDAQGRLVRTLVSSWQGAGQKSLTWNAANDQGQDVSAGVYFYVLETGGQRQIRKMILLK